MNTFIVKRECVGHVAGPYLTNHFLKRMSIDHPDKGWPTFSVYVGGG